MHIISYLIILTQTFETTWLNFQNICDLRRFCAYAAIEADLGPIVDIAAIDAYFGCSIIEYFVDTFSDVNTGFTILNSFLLHKHKKHTMEMLSDRFFLKWFEKCSQRSICNKEMIL